MRGLMQDYPLTVDAIFRHVEQHYGDGTIVTDRPGRRHADRRTRSGPSAPAGSAACSTTWASAPTAGSARSRGTAARTSSCTSPRRARGRVLHTLNIRLFPEQLTYIVNHAEDEVDLRRPVAAAAAVAADRHVRDRAARRGDGRRRRRRDPRRRPRDLHDYEDAAGRRRSRSTFHVDGREPRRVDVLHERHHRQPEGRRLLAPLDVPAHDGRDGADTPRRSASATTSDAGRADVPRQRLGPRPGRRGRGRHPGHARARAVSRRRSPT